MRTLRRLLGISFLAALGYAALRLYRQYQEDSAFDLAPVGNMGSNGSTPSGAKRAISKELLKFLPARPTSSRSNCKATIFWSAIPAVGATQSKTAFRLC